MPWQRLVILPPHQRSQGVAQTRRRWCDLDASGFHGRNFAFRITPAAGNDGTGMTHAAAGRRGAAGNESDHGLLAATFGFIGKELSGVLFGRATNLADHDDRFGRLVGQKHRQHVDELGALDRVAADAALREWSDRRPHM